MSALASISSLRQEFENIKGPIKAATGKPVKVTDYLLNQVEVLQGAFVSLCDTVFREMEDMRNRNARWEEECLQRLSAQMNPSSQRPKTARESPFKSRGSDADDVMSAVTSPPHTSPGSSLDRRTADLERGLWSCQSEVQLIHSQLDALEVRNRSTHLPFLGGKVHQADSTLVDSLVSEAIVEAAPDLIARVVQDCFSTRVQEKIDENVKEQVDRRVVPFQKGVLDHVNDLSQELAETVRCVRQVERDVSTYRTSRAADLKPEEALSHQVSSLIARVDRVETLQKEGPQIDLTASASSSSSALSALSSRLSTLEHQHSRFSKGIEGILKVLVDDGAAAAATARAAVHEMEGNKLAINDTRNALESVAAVFAQILNIPSPLPRSNVQLLTGDGGGLLRALGRMEDEGTWKRMIGNNLICGGGREREKDVEKEKGGEKERGIKCINKECTTRNNHPGTIGNKQASTSNTSNNRNCDDGKKAILNRSNYDSMLGLREATNYSKNRQDRLGQVEELDRLAMLRLGYGILP